MKYLKCESCHNFNLLNSEYQIFCNACGKKIPNNFKEWQKKYPAKNFEDYIVDVGVLKTVTKQKKEMPSTRRILQICFLVIGVSVGFYYGNKMGTKIPAFFHELAHPVSDLLDKDWKKQYVMNNEAFIETPYLLEEKDINALLPDEAKKVIKVFETYLYVNEVVGFGIGFSAVIYDSSIIQANLKNASDSALLASMQEMNGVDLFSNDENTFINQYPAIIKKGSFTSNNKEVNFKMISCLKDNLKMTQVFTYWLSKSKDYELLTDRIINSLEVK